MPRLLFVVLAIVAPTAIAGPSNAAAAPVAVTASGWSQTGTQSYSQSSYGLVLRNRSATQDAAVVDVIVTVFGDAGALLGRDEQVISVIPAATTFYVGNDLTTTLRPGRIVRLGVHVSVVQMVAKHFVLPTVSGVRVVGPYSDLIIGRVTNVYRKQAIPWTAPYLWVVYFDSSGKIIGGEYDPGGAGLTDPNYEKSIPPGHSVGIRTGPAVALPMRIARAAASVDPRTYPRH